MDRQINREKKGIAKALKDQIVTKDSPMVLRVLNEALGGGDKARAKREEGEMMKKPFNIDYTKKQTTSFDPDASYEDAEETQTKSGKKLKSYIQVQGETDLGNYRLLKDNIKQAHKVIKGIKEEIKHLDDR